MQRNLKSLCGQTDEKFNVYLVCNVEPKNKIKHPKIYTVKVNFEVPNTSEKMIEDKYKKIKRGLVEVKSSSLPRLPSGRRAVMVVDADDRVHCDVAAWVSDHPEGHGWYFPKGYIYPYGQPFLFTSTVLGGAFYKHCGTSAVVYCEDSDLPDTMDASGQSSIVLRCGHHTIVDCMDERGTPLRPLPFRGACYVTDTGDNHSGVSWLRWKGKKKLARQVVSFRPLLSCYQNRFALSAL
ncbi:hypothetical protein GGP90_000852 [Salinibacter ruber]|nr:hypothetical protein [Salinibacter ruber]MCS3756089.1 hypothetical protein [Salinibacter ruber]